MHEYIKQNYFYFNSEHLIKGDYEKSSMHNTYEHNEKLMENYCSETGRTGYRFFFLWCLPIGFQNLFRHT
jgi:hypothetical protein